MPHAAPHGLVAGGTRVAHDRAVFHRHAPPRARADRRVVRDDDQCHAARVQGLEQVHDIVAGGAIEVARRLVGEDQRRLHDGGARDRHPLALAAGELVRPVPGAVGDAVVVQRLRDARGALLRRDAGQHHRQGDVLGGGQARHQVETLEHEADALAAHARLLLRRQRGHVAPLEPVGAGIGPVEQAEDVEQGRLARAGRAHHRHVLAGGDAQIDRAQRVHLAVAELEDALDRREFDLLRARHGVHFVAGAARSPPRRRP